MCFDGTKGAEPGRRYFGVYNRVPNRRSSSARLVTRSPEWFEDASDQADATPTLEDDSVRLQRQEALAAPPAAAPVPAAKPDVAAAAAAAASKIAARQCATWEGETRGVMDWWLPYWHWREHKRAAADE